GPGPGAGRRGRRPAGAREWRGDAPARLQRRRGVPAGPRPRPAGGPGGGGRPGPHAPAGRRPLRPLCAGGACGRGRRPAPGRMGRLRPWPHAPRPHPTGGCVERPRPAPRGRLLLPVAGQPRRRAAGPRCCAVGPGCPAARRPSRPDPETCAPGGLQLREHAQRTTASRPARGRAARRKQAHPARHAGQQRDLRAALLPGLVAAPRGERPELAPHRASAQRGPRAAAVQAERGGAGAAGRQQVGPRQEAGL
ncbi:hypothetical protein APUTEX25_001510, partial [Auxenochlorella protothecoides]